jgi:thiamine pyrophosphate-dependent acetolactate synthase large subunit-like protein
MSQQQALEAIVPYRDSRIVVSTMSAAKLWPQISDTPMDFTFLPSTMGQAPGLGLGLALAQPERGVIVINGDGSMLMNLGALVTIAAHPAPLYLIVMDNGMYEVTGGQPTAGSRNVRFEDIAKAAGIPRTYTFEDFDSWERGAEESLRGEGPVFICLKVEARYGQSSPKPIHPMRDQIIRLQKTLNVEPLFSQG